MSLDQDPPPIPVRIGNDVVDRQHPRCRDRPAGDRLPQRILTGTEMEWFRAPALERDRLRRLWSLWAAKETAFKVVSKLEGEPPVFHHRRFVVTLREEAAGALIHLEGSVRWEDLDVNVEGVANRNFVHLAGWGGRLEAMDRLRLEMGVEGGDDPDTPSGVATPDGRGIEREDGVHSLLSLRARGVARTRLASYLPSSGPDSGSGAERRIRILTSSQSPGRTPPRIVVDGRERHDMDLSLSHHGRYVGWALLLPLVRTGSKAQKPGR